MGYLMKKMLRDFKNNWTQFVSVLLMALISVLIFSGMASVWTGIDHQVDSYIKKTNMADLWVSGIQITDDDLIKLADLDNVSKASLSMSVSLSPANSDSELKISVVNNADVSTPLIMDGIAFNTSSDGIWIDSEYARLNNISVGDAISIDGYINEVNLKVLGTVMSPEYIYYTGNVTETVPNYEKYGYAFVGEKTMLTLCPKIIYTQAKITTSGEILDKAFEDILGERLICVQDRDDYISFARSSQESQQMQKMAILFSAVFIILALMTMYTSMVRLVNRQLMQIGTMKALGIKDITIRLHYACYGLIIPVIGGLIGLVAGRYTVSRVLMSVKQNTLTLPGWDLVHSKISFVLIGVIALCCMFASIWAVQKGLRGMPVEIMRGNTKKKGEIGKDGSKGIIAQLSYEWRWTLRDILNNKIRFLMGIIGVMGGIVLMIAGLGVKDAINNSNDFIFTKQFNYEAKALLSKMGSTFDFDGEKQWIQESNAELKTNSDVKLSIVTVCDQGSMLRFFDDNDKDIALPESGAIISRKLAESLNVSAGDTIKIRIFGIQELLEVRIEATTKILSPQGVFMSKTAYEKIGQSFTPTSMLTSSTDTQGLLDNEAVKSVATKDEQIENANIIADSAMSIVNLLILAAIVLSIVILYNLGILSHVERTREYATMKVLGFYQKDIRRIAVRECILTTLIGWVIAIPVGIQFLKIYVKIVSFDSLEWIASVRMTTLIIASVGIIAVSLFINFLLSNKVKKIVMVEALKSVD